MKSIFNLLVLLSLGFSLQAAKPLNIVLILVDDLGWMDLSCQGSRYYETPNLDRLASIIRQSLPLQIPSKAHSSELETFACHQ